ncbi:MAG: Rpn family recombination-promoting nuclease/putative transposase, partial [Turicibacter sp.]|nr:Rpn family recombination-promoting nuclease/putative transposase [Turicibacter sp.]
MDRKMFLHYEAAAFLRVIKNFYVQKSANFAIIKSGGSKMKKRKGTRLVYTFKSDVLFKMLFVRNPDLLKRLVAVLLDIPLASIQEFYLTNTEMPPEEMGKKFCRLDINMIVDGKQVNLEIQVLDEGNYPERIMFHW